MDDQPRTAVAISLITKDTLDATLFHLAQLEADGQVKHVTDEAGVMRWVMVDAEAQTSDAMELGAQVMLNHHVFDVTPSQAWHLGF